MKKQPKFDYALCIACGICSQSCPVSCIGMTKNDVDKYKKAYPRLEYGECTGCGICQKVCPLDAVTVTEE